ncbi:MAG: malonate decarboxylase acyl carrier protein [Deltaproteobacteria bacterium]|nr:malonate decarboxylase acyl carrier protein [Deltaproteobacteria bacterium]
MAKQLHELNFEFKAENPTAFPADFIHYGVVGSGDMEALMEKQELCGAVTIKVVTPVTGYDEVWRRVLERFVNDTGISDARIEINDNNATPVVVSLRLRQALSEIAGGGE